VLAGVQREIVAAQARDHAVRRLGCRRCQGVCRVKAPYCMDPAGIQ
jgi:hypothetical protein